MRSRWMAIGCDVLALDAEHRDSATRWNDLWLRSGSSLPVARFEHLVLWKRHFAPKRAMIALVVHDGAQWLAALPLVAGHRYRVCPVWCLPGNEWSWCGDLLFDAPNDRVDEVADTLARHLHRLGRFWTWLDPIPRSSLGWQNLQAAIERENSCRRESHRYTIGQIRLRDTEGPMDVHPYQGTWSGNFRRQMRKMLRRAKEQGGVELLLPSPASDLDVSEHVKRGFSVEDHGWKSRAGTSVLSRPPILAFFVEQAQQLARDGHLHLVFLMHRGEPIAFEYGWLAKGVYYSPKVGYDERFSHLSPGQLLRYHLVEQLVATSSCHTFDFLGPLSEATAKWATQTYPVDRLVCGTGTWGSNTSLRILSASIPTIRSVHGAMDAIAERLTTGRSVSAGIR